MSDPRPVVLYGASGFSGRLVAEFLREYDVPFVAAGRDGARVQEVLDLVPGSSTADYEVVEVEHTVDALTELLHGRRVVCNTVGPCIYYGDTVVEAALAAGCHYIDIGGEAPWVRRVHETWDESFRDAGLLVAPATAYMSATAETAIRVAQEQQPGIDTLEVLSMFRGFPTYGSTQTIFGQLQWESWHLEGSRGNVGSGSPSRRRSRSVDSAAMSGPDAPTLRASSSERGIRPDELAAAARVGLGITPTDLERWLLEHQLATNTDGRLQPTRRALVLAAVLE
jgi:short subunit dehydrogenase-like uncharacterized protein